MYVASTVIAKQQDVTLCYSNPHRQIYYQSFVSCMFMHVIATKYVMYFSS